MTRQFRVAAKIAGTNQIVALGGMVATKDFSKAAASLSNLELVLLPPAHTLNQFDGKVPSPAFVDGFAGTFKRVMED